jgi:hypothetical protein
MLGLAAVSIVGFRDSGSGQSGLVHKLEYLLQQKPEKIFRENY